MGASRQLMVSHQIDKPLNADLCFVTRLASCRIMISHRHLIGKLLMHNYLTGWASLCRMVSHQISEPLTNDQPPDWRADDS
jgi:hypothetical protein